MGFEVFLSAYEHGESSEFPLAVVEAAFTASIKSRSTVHDGSLVLDIEYPVDEQPALPKVIIFNGKEYPSQVRDRSTLFVGVCGANGELTDGFMVAGPAGNTSFYASLLTILQSAHTALYWSGNGALIIAREDMRDHLPEEMIETLGAPFIAKVPEDIKKRIQES